MPCAYLWSQEGMDSDSSLHTILNIIPTQPPYSNLMVSMSFSTFQFLLSRGKLWQARSNAALLACESLSWGRFRAPVIQYSGRSARRCSHYYGSPLVLHSWKLRPRSNPYIFPTAPRHTQHAVLVTQTNLSILFSVANLKRGVQRLLCLEVALSVRNPSRHVLNFHVFLC